MKKLYVYGILILGCYLSIQATATVDNSKSLLIPSKKALSNDAIKNDTCSSANSCELSVAKSLLLFEKNKGQFDNKVKFLSKGKGYNIALGQHPVVELFKYKQEDRKTSNKHGALDFEPQKDLILTDHALFQIQILGANKDPKITALDKVEKKTNYITGEKIHWITDVENYQKIKYQEILKDIDVVYYGNNGRLEYDFVLKPRAKVESIKMKFNGVDTTTINDQGQLVLKLGEQEIVQNAPVTYQIDNNGIRLPIKSNYIKTSESIGFQVGEYDQNKELIIDPVIEYSRYYGGSQSEIVHGIDVDSADNIYMFGATNSSGLASTGSYQDTSSIPPRTEFISNPNCTGCTDLPPGIPTAQVQRVVIGSSNLREVFVTKFSSDGKTILWSTYFSHPTDHLGFGVNSFAVSPVGEAAFGLTASSSRASVAAGFPLVNPTQSHSSSYINVYVAKLNANGNGLVFSTYLNSGITFGWLRGLDVHSDGSVAVAGYGMDFTFSGNPAVSLGFPEINPIAGQSCTLDTSTFSDISDGWVIRFDPTGTANFASCLGGETKNGSFRETLRGVAFGPSNGHLYVIGASAMTDFPTTNPIQAAKSFAEYKDATVTQIDADNSQIIFSTYLGPKLEGVTLDAKSNFANNVFNEIFPYDIKVDLQGNIYIVGQTNVTGWPTEKAIQSNINTHEPSLLQDYTRFFTSINSDLFFTKINPSTPAIEISTYLGGSSHELEFAQLVLDSNSNVYLYGLTQSNDFPMMNPIQSSIIGKRSPVISKIDPVNGKLLFSSYLGGGNDFLTQHPGGIVVNSMNKIIVASSTDLNTYPIVGPASPYNGGSSDATLAIINQVGGTDTDGDGVLDPFDAFVNDPTEWLDTDTDGTGNNSDTDDDGDGEPDVTDIFPLDSSEKIDTDKDGLGDNADPFPTDDKAMYDLDGNGVGDIGETDADKDGVSNSSDFKPFDPNVLYDSDEDGIPNSIDTDDDGDGTPDATDVAPLNPFDPMITFESYNAHAASIFKSPWPQGFSQLAGSDKGWTSATDQANSGKTSMGTREIADGENASLQYDETFQAGTLSFYYKVDSEQANDQLTFALDGNILLTSSGNVDWTQFSTPITAGVHNLTWNYVKNGSISAGADAAWIDDIQGTPAPPLNLVTTIIPPTAPKSLNTAKSLTTYVIEVFNDSPYPATRANFKLDVPSGFTNASWKCSVVTASTGTNCASKYLSTGITDSGTGNINTNIDIGSKGKVKFELTGTVASPSTQVVITATTTADSNIREDDTQDNTVSYPELIFKGGFEQNN